MSAASTLLDVFVPPEGMVGHSAALVAMTGAEDFLEAAVQRFSGLRPRQRAELGNILVYLMLDGHRSASRESVLPPGRVPSLHEFQPRMVEPTSLLHAKLALLAFAPNRTADPIHLRLAVLTANFTYTSARQQLELVWTIEVPLDGTAKAIDRAEVAAAGEFVEQLLERRFHRDERALPTKQRRLTARLDALLAAASGVAPANGKPRFIHSLDRPLYEQIRERFRRIRSPKNLLLCGSGFFERPLRGGTKPKTIERLENVAKLTSSARQIVVVEPTQAGAVTEWAHRAERDGWTIVSPADEMGARRLHAKFVYVGHLRETALSSGWLYIGSGNLSQRGLCSSEHSPVSEIVDGKRVDAWNIECGVVFEVPERLDADGVRSRFFWDQADHDLPELEVGDVGDAPPSDSLELVCPPPILSAVVDLGPPRVLRLLWREDTKEGAQVSVGWTGADWRTVARDEPRVALQEADEPTALRVRDDDSQQEWIVPVIDPAGRICWQPPRFATYADALAALLDFPIRPAEATDDEDDSDGHGDSDGDAEGSSGGIGDEKRYALHAAAELIEKVAALQLALPASMLDDWLEHLDRMFRASFPDALVATWRERRIDVFLHLREPDLRPPQLTEKQRARYCAVLNGAALSWGLR